MSPSKSKSSGKQVLTGRSASMTFGLPDSDETLTLERGVPTEVPAQFAEAVSAVEEIYPEGSVPEDAVVAPPAAEPPPQDEPADESPPAPAETAPEPGAQTGEQTTPDQA